jgi:hypothetical protein
VGYPQGLRETDRHPPGRPPRDIGPNLVPISEPPTLDGLGLTKKESALAQKIASLPVQEFEEVKAGTMAISEAIKQRDKAVRENERAAYIAEKLACAQTD